VLHYKVRCTFLRIHTNTHIDYHFQDELERQKADNASLRDKLEDANEHQGARGNSKPDANEMIPRPKGTAGSNFSIQVEMGLSGSAKKYDKYKAIQVYPDDTVLDSCSLCG